MRTRLIATSLQQSTLARAAAERRPAKSLLAQLALLLLTTWLVSVACGGPTGTASKTGGATVTGKPGVIVSSFNGVNRLYAFAQGANGHLYVNYWDGARWNWADQGAPSGATVAGDPAVVRYDKVYGPDAQYAFVRGSNGHLYVNYWDGARWNWADQGAPSGATVGGDPGGVVANVAQQSRLYAFATGSGGHLHVDYWDTTQWLWADQGVPQ